MIAAEKRTESRLSARRSRSLAQRERDAALDRLGRARRWLIAGAAGLTAAIVAVISAVAPGRSLGAKGHAALANASAPAPVTSPRQMPPLASPGALGLQGPSEAPEGDSGQSSAPAPAQSSSSQSAAPQSTPSQPAPVAPQPAPVTSGGS